MLVALKRNINLFSFNVAKRYFLLIGLVIAIAISWQQINLGSINNYEIFSASFANLTAGKNLYLFYPQQYADLFLYNPTFAVLFAPFGFLGHGWGIVLWSCMGMILFLFAVDQLPLSKSAKLFLLLFTLPDSINSLQHLQVNHLNIAIMLLVPVFLKREKMVVAAFLTAMVFFIKVYPAAIGLCFLFFPNKIKYLFWCVVFSAGFFVLPLIFINFNELLIQYQNWFTSLAGDRSTEELSTTLSLISIDYQWLKEPINATYIQMFGLLAMAAVLPLGHKHFDNGKWQMSYVAAILLFVIVFNHAAESATYLIATLGVGIWFLNSERSVANTSLLLLVVVGTILPITDIFPSYIKSNFIQPFSIRAVPCVLVWVKLIIDLLLFQDKSIKSYV